MLMPALSVTLIGVVVALAAGALRHLHPARTALPALFGAWAGFAAGAVVGVITDVISGSGSWLAVIGHLAAVAGAVLAVRAWALGPARDRGAATDGGSAR